MKLIEFIISIFKIYSNFIFIKAEGKEYTYAEIYESSNNLSKELDIFSAAPIKIGLIGENSYQWIITFFGILFSKHVVVLMSPKLSIHAIKEVCIRERVDLLICNFEVTRTNFPLVYTSIKLDDITQFKSKKEFFIVDDLFDNKYIIVVTPNSLKRIKIEYDQIVEKIDILSKFRIFKETTNYIVNLEFTYNYILGLLLPFSYGNTIQIIDEDYTSIPIIRDTTICITAHKFELLYRNYIDNSCDWLMNFLSKWKLWIIKRLIIKRKLRYYFPNLEKLIIVNSTLSYKTENTLSKIKFPYTVTYGTVETMGLASYSNPKDFIFGSVGKPIMSMINTLKGDDILKIKKNNLYFYHRRGEDLITWYGIAVTITIERILKGLPYVIDGLLIVRKEVLNLIVSVDKEACDYYRITRRELQDLLNESIKKINNKVYQHEKIDQVIILYDDFKRDSYDRILKQYYQLE